MNEIEMTKHIKDLTKIIQNQNETLSDLNRSFAAVHRQIQLLQNRLIKIEYDKVN